MCLYFICRMSEFRLTTAVAHVCSFSETLSEARTSQTSTKKKETREKYFSQQNTNTNSTVSEGLLRDSRGKGKRSRSSRWTWTPPSEGREPGRSGRDFLPCRSSSCSGPDCVRRSGTPGPRPCPRSQTARGSSLWGQSRSKQHVSDRKIQGSA